MVRPSFQSEDNKMSGKYEKKKQNSTAKKGASGASRKRSGQQRGLRAVLAVLIVLLAVGIGIILYLEFGPETQSPDPNPGTTAPSETTAPPTLPPETTVPYETEEQVTMNLGKGLTLTDIGSYTGIYMEDGTDEVVSGILMIIVTNNGEEDIQYAEISLDAGEETAFFSVSTLPVGESAVLLEQNRMEYSAETAYTSAVGSNIALFDQPMSLCEDLIQIQSLDGAMNITNISGEDITGDIVIYYKNAADGMYYGGITYRVRISGGLAADEVKQIMSQHFSTSDSAIMFVTCG